MDPEKVRRFADELQRFNTDLENRLVLLQARFSSLGDTWQDQEHAKFAEEFKQIMKALKSACCACSSSRLRTCNSRSKKLRCSSSSQLRIRTTSPLTSSSVGRALLTTSLGS